MKKLCLLKSYISLVVLYCLLLNFGSQLALSQTQMDTPTPTPISSPTQISPELQKLKDRNAILEEQKKAAELEKAINDTKFPKPSTTPLAGNTELDAGVKIESEMMAYRALKSAAKKIADEVEAETENKKVAILNDQWLMGMRDYWAVKNKLGLMRKSYDEILAQPTPQPIKVSGADEDKGVIASIYKGPDNTTTALKANINLMSLRIVGGEPLTRIAEDNPAEVPSNNRFASAIGAVTSSFGMVGSLVGAAVDLVALARTDTKITGFSFTVQESALVSEVYRNLSTPFRYYPAEFSPNVNLQKQFAIITEMEKVGELKDRAEVLIIGIDETEKVYQAMVAEKEALEARQKQLPLDIAAVEKKIKDLKEKVKKKNTELEVKIVELEHTLDELKLEKEVGIKKKLEKNAASIAKLEIKLSQLYSQIKPIASSGKVINNFIDIASSLDKTGKELLDRSYTFEEIKRLTNDDREVKKSLTTLAIKHLKTKGKDLSTEDRYRLLKPYDLDRLKIFVKIGNYIRSNPRPLSQLETGLFLSDFEQLKLIHPADEDFLTEKNKLAKERGINLIKLRSLNKQFDKFSEEVVKPDNLGINAVTKLLQTENMMAAFGCNTASGECPDAYALVLKVIDAGGNNKVKKNLLTMIATGDDISHSGGAIVEYKLYDMNGKIKTSSVCLAYEAYRKAKNIKNEKDVDNAVCTKVSPDIEEGKEKEKEPRLANTKKEKSTDLKPVKN